MDLLKKIKEVLREETKIPSRLRRRFSRVDKEVNYQMGVILKPNNICHYQNGKELLGVITYSVIENIYYEYFEDIDDDSEEWKIMYDSMEKYITNRYGEEIINYYDEHCSKEEQITKTIKEETDKIFSALRRVTFSDDKIKHHLKRFSLSLFVDFKDIDELIDKVCNNTSYEVLEPGILHMSDKDADKVIDEFAEKIKDKYYDFIKNYIDTLFNQDDDETYCFRKHSDRYMGGDNRGFFECMDGWNTFLIKYGSWFPDLDWNEIKKNMSSNPNNYILIKKPLENHNFEYYFSVFKKS
jgi:ABC-type transporter MlaC component